MTQNSHQSGIRQSNNIFSPLFPTKIFYKFLTYLPYPSP